MDRTTELALVELRRDGRLSFSEIAHRLGTTRTAIAHRIGPLLESGELRVLAAVHPRVLGLRVLAHVGVRVQGRVDEIADAMLELPSAVFVSQTIGPFHIAVEVHVQSDEALHEQLRLMRAIPGVLELTVTIYHEVLSSFFLGPEPDVTDLVLDEADRAIIGLLQEDGRVPLRDLSAAAGLSITGARARLHRLLDSAVMRVGAIGQQAEAGHALTVGVGASTSDASALIELLGARPGLQFMARTIGRFDLVATVPVSSLDELREVLDAARAAPGVLSVDAWLHERIRQERYQFAPHVTATSVGATRPRRAAR